MAPDWRNYQGLLTFRNIKFLLDEINIPDLIKMRFSKLIPYILLFTVEALVLFSLVIPTLMSLGFSFQSYNLTKPDNIQFIWFRNYIKIFTDVALRQTIFNSGYFLVVTIVFSFIGSITIASALNRNFWGRQILLSILILPWALPQVVNALLWTNIFNPTYGALNGLLFRLGIIDSYMVWTNHPFITINIINLILLWKTLPLVSIMVLAAMQAIPDELYDAAKIDGADALRCFLYITIPSIMPTMAIVLSISSIVALNIFDEIYVVASFRGDTRSLAMDAYLKAFRFLDIGYGSAIAYILLIAGALFSIFYLRNLYKEIQM
jgi:multiple sugar transport system permease protein